MKIENIKVKCEGYVHCESSFYAAHDCISPLSYYNFHTGINELIGDIDSGNWAISYLLSMHKYKQEDFILSIHPEIFINCNLKMQLSDLLQYTCYMDKIHPIFPSGFSVKDLVFDGIKKNKLSYASEDIRDIFRIDAERFLRPLTGVGNEIFRAMAAIAYANNRQVFCFPWLSQRRFNGYHGHLTDLLDILESLNKIVILPVGK